MGKTKTGGKKPSSPKKGPSKKGKTSSKKKGGSKKRTRPTGQAPPPGNEDYNPNYYDFSPPPEPPKDGQAMHPHPPPPHGQYYYPPPGGQVPPGYPPPQAFIRPDYDGTKWFNGFGSHFRKVDAFKTLGETWAMFKKIWTPLLVFYLTFTFLFLLPLLLVAVGTMVLILFLTGFDERVMMLMQVGLIIPMFFFNIIVYTISAFGYMGLSSMVNKYMKTHKVKWTDGYAHIRDNFGLFLKMGVIYSVIVNVLSYLFPINIAILLLLSYYHASVAHHKERSFIENVKNSVRFAVDQNAILFSLLMVLVTFVAGMILGTLLTVVIIIVMVIIVIGVISSSGTLLIVGIVIGIVCLIIYLVLASAVGVFTITGHTYCYVKYRWGYGDEV